MSRYWSESHYEQPSSSKLKKNSIASKKKADKKGDVLNPIVVQGRIIAKNWWGKAWCENLERYADYENRLDRGRRYVRAGTVIDLRIEKGKVLAKVQGRRKAPYKVEIRISPLSEEKCQNIIGKCNKKLGNIEALLGGNFPEEMQELFKDRDGLFPSPKEIGFTCSCPDWALMCKHVAAVLYGVGVRLDEQPLLFFTLRGIDVERFIDVALENKVEQMLKNADKIDKKHPRILDPDIQRTLFRELV